MMVFMIWLFLLFPDVQTPHLEQKVTQIVIYRQRDWGRQYFFLKINGQTVKSDFKSNTYIVIEVPVGELILETGGNMFTEKKKFKMVSDPGITYYLEAIVSYEFRSSSLYLLKRNEDDFLDALRKLTKDDRAKDINP